MAYSSGMREDAIRAAQDNAILDAGHRGFSGYKQSQVDCAVEDATAHVLGDPEHIQDILEDVLTHKISGCIARLCKTQLTMPRNHKEKIEDALNDLITELERHSKRAIESQTIVELEKL